jgi:hypothetical protein
MYISLTIFLFRSGIAFYFQLLSTVQITVRPKKKCVFTVTFQKNLGSVGINFLIHLDQRSMCVCRLLSVVCKLFTFQASSPKPLGRLEPNLAGMFFIPVGYSIWLPGPIICSDWLKFQRSSSLKLMN